MTGVLQAMAAMGLTLSWAVVRLGWEGPGVLGPQIDADDVRASADAVLAAADPAVRSWVAELALTPGGGEVAEGLRHLAPEVGPRAERIWRAFLVARRLERLPATAVEGLIALGELWGDLGLPDDMPHELQGRGANRQAPEAYYTQENLARRVARHRQWLDAELSALRDGGPEGGPAR